MSTALSRPPLEDGETYISTSYKARIIGSHIATHLESHRSEGKKGPLMVGLQGPQGCGKTTLCNALLDYLQQAPRNLRIAVLSLDDLYKTNAGLKEVANSNPSNPLLAGRGPPGTHDSGLATFVLSAITSINDHTGSTVELPIFDKSLCAGEGDRSKETVKVVGPLDVFILEGWSMGFGSMPEDELKQRYDSKSSLSDTDYFTKHTFETLSTINRYLQEFEQKVYPSFETIVQVEPESYKHVFEWRTEQERVMKEKNGGKGMTDEQVQAFVERYMPGYELWKEGIWSKDKPWYGKGLRLWYGGDREITKVAMPTTSDQGPTPAEAEESGKPEPRYNPNWSRKFLTGKSPLNPTYDQIPPLSTLHQDSSIFKITPHLAFFPIQGPGGRIGVHPLAKKGRMVVGGEGYLSGGTEVADFTIDPFAREDGSARIVLAGEDGVIRAWSVGKEGVKGAGPEPDLVIKGKGIDKIAQIAFHPTAKDLVGVATNGQSSSIRVFNLATSEEALSADLGSNGVFNFSWNHDGSKVAVASKDGNLLVIDPRSPTTVLRVKAYDSPRSFQTAWVSNKVLLTVGFAKGSQRRINLFALDSTSELQKLHSLLIDISPSVLFPVFDPDTNLLYVWGKGERQIQTYEIYLDNKTEPILKLQSYTASQPQLGLSFFPKKWVDVKKVEVAKALRLTAKSIEEVSFTVPRNKPEFFQNDIYLDTADVETASLSASEWLSGQNKPSRKISLQPQGMTRLSDAPQVDTKAKSKFVPAKDVMSEQERKQKEMDSMFARAKLDESSDEEEEQRGVAAPDADDW